MSLLFVLKTLFSTKLGKQFLSYPNSLASGLTTENSLISQILDYQFFAFLIDLIQVVGRIISYKHNDSLLSFSNYFQS